MSPTASRQALQQLDRALFALIDERARLVARHPELPPEPERLQRLARRFDGPFPLESLEVLAAALEAGCRAARGEAAQTTGGAS